jgi:rhodanese-related sulfurtransferase
MTQNRLKKQGNKNHANRKRTAAKKAPAARRSRSLFWVSVFLALAVAAVLVGVAVSGQMAREAKGLASLPAEIDVQEAYDLYREGVFLLDVRTQGEWDELHVPNTTLIPLDELESRLNELPKDQEIVVMCRSGNRSQAGREILLNAGFADTTSMAGGIIDWKSAGFPTVP